MLKTPKLTVYVKRNCTTRTPKYVIEQLKHRSLIRVAGPEAKDFLQGVVTNDINHLGPLSGGSMYSLFLNTKGRILWDSIIYRNDQHVYLVECDSEGAPALTKHLKMYRVRRKIDINVLPDHKILVMFDSNNYKQENVINSSNGKLEEIVVPSQSVPILKDLLVFRDPRVKELGNRIILKPESTVNNIKELIGNINTATSNETYRILRYNLGIGEGLTDLPHGDCFPLESNCDYLHGVSFHKGCYIGQELTARTHHTGVVRKRLMPLYFTKTPSQLPKDNKIIHEQINLGRLRGIEGNVGLALLRIHQALEFGEIAIGDGKATVKKPSWWPHDSTTERLKV